MHYTKEVLKNGLTIVKVPSRDVESVVVDIFVKTGSRSESSKEAGISHFLEHFLFKGTAKFPTAMAISEIIDGIGGDTNAATGQESTQFYIKSRSSFLPLIFEILTDMVQAPLFNTEELEREKGVIIEELNMYLDQPPTVASENLDLLMWGKEPLGQPIIGRKETIMGFQPKDFREYMKKHYCPGNMIIGIGGNFKEKELDALIKKYWSKLPAKKGGGWKRVTEKQNKPRLKLEFKETEQAHWALGFRAFDDNDKRNSAVAVLSSILGGGMSSRLFNEIREKRGLAYYVSSGSVSFQDVGQFIIRAGVQVGKIEESISVTMSEIRRICESVVGEQELGKAKEYIKGRSSLALEDSQVKLDWYLEQAAFKKNIKTPQEAFEKIDKVTAKDVLKVAQEIFQVNKASLSIIGPYKDDKKFKKLLR